MSLENVNETIINPVVMAGGVGSRLWPLSRAAFPTQLKLQKRDELVHQREVYRPWGSYDSVDSGLKQRAF